MSAEVSIVVPVFNSARYLRGSLLAIAGFLGGRAGGGELVVVDDGSRDTTLDVVRAAQDELGVPLTLLVNGENRGKGFSVRRGLAAASGELVVFTDADLAYPVENFTRVLDALAGGADLAIASRVHPDSRYVTSPRFFRRIYTRHTIGRAFNLLTRLVLVPDIHDTQAGLKGLHRAALDQLLPHLTLDRFSFDVELLVVARRLGLAIAEVPVTFEYQSEPSTLELGRDSLRMLSDVARVVGRQLGGAYPAIVRRNKKS